MNRFTGKIDLQVRLARAGGRGVALQISSSTGEEFEGDLPTSPATLRLSELRKAPRVASEMKTLGRELFEAVFRDDGERVYRTALAVANERFVHGSDSQLCIRLGVGPADLSDLPWELLFDPARDRFLAADHRVILSRNLTLLEPTMRFPTEGSVRVLGVFPQWSELETASEKKSLAELARKDGIALSMLEKEVTPSSIRSAMRMHAPQVVHFSGHAYCEGGRAGLWLDSGRESVQEIDATGFAGLLCRSGRPPSFVVLNACESAMGIASGSRGLTRELLRHGVMAVVAMQSRIMDRQAAMFSAELYESLAASSRGNIGTAVTDGRAALLQDRGHDPSFASPILYLRGSHFELWPGKRASQPPEEPEAPGRADELLGTDRSIVNQGGVVGRDITIHGGVNSHVASRSSSADAEYWREKGRENLDLGRFEQAKADFSKATEQGVVTGQDLYLRALSTLGGHRPRSLKWFRFQEIERDLWAAVRIERQVHFLLFLAALQFEFYVSNDLREPLPGHRELLEQAKSGQVDYDELQSLLDRLRLSDENPVHRYALQLIDRQAGPRAR